METRWRRIRLRCKAFDDIFARDHGDAMEYLHHMYASLDSLGKRRKRTLDSVLASMELRLDSADRNPSRLLQQLIEYRKTTRGKLPYHRS